jgi:iron(III) transport system substrate-binding protein
VKKPSKMVVIASLIALTAMITSACGSSQSNDSTSSASSPAASDTASPSASDTASPSPAASSGDNVLIFYSAEGFDQAVADAFTKKTGITVKLVDDSTGPLLAKMQAEKANPQWDVTWFDGPSSMQGLDNQNMLYKDFQPTGTANYNDLGKKLMSKDSSYFPVTVTAAGAIGYNTNLVKASELPKDWSDLLKPAYKGQFAMNNPSISGPTYTTVLGLMNLQGGIPQGESFFTQLKANGLNVFDSNGPTLTNLIKGTVKYAIAQDSAIIAKMDGKNPIKILYPTSGVSMLSSNIGIDAKAPHLEAAKQFVEYVLSVEGQKVMVDADAGGDSEFASIIQGGPSKAGIRPDGIKWNSEDPIFGAQHENEIKSWFTQNIVQK